MGESSNGETACKGSSNLFGHEEAPLLKVVFPNICEKWYFKEDARDYLGEKFCFIFRELTFSIALIGNVYHQSGRISSSEDGTLPFKENPKGGDPMG